MSLLIRRGVTYHARRHCKYDQKSSTFVARSISQNSLLGSRSDQENPSHKFPIPKTNLTNRFKFTNPGESRGSGLPQQAQRNNKIHFDDESSSRQRSELSTFRHLKDCNPTAFQSNASPDVSEMLMKSLPYVMDSSVALWRSQMKASATYRAISALPLETVRWRPHVVVSSHNGGSRHFSFSSPSSSSPSDHATTAMVVRKPGGIPPNLKFSTSAKIPTPKSPQESPSSVAGFLANFNPASLANSAISLSTTALKAILNFLLRLPYNSWYYLTHGEERREKINGIVEMAKKEANHYWMGSKLLVADIRTARSLVGRTLTGSTLTRRERKQLLRTVSDLFRLVPFSMFMIIPFMEFALPFALRIFPNLLPSTFQDSLKAEESMKRELKSRIAMAQFFQETLEELAKEQKRIAVTRMEENPDDDKSKSDTGEVDIASKQKESAASMLVFLDRARRGEMMPPDVIIQYANFFKDDLTLDNMPRMQLINMCRYMSIPPYGADAFLRFQLRHRIRTLKEDDQRILWEGIDSLTKMELREACQERGMRSTGLSKDAYKRSLQQWLDLSVNKNVPVSLLIMSRTFFLQDEIQTPTLDGDSQGVAGLVDAISGLDKEVLNEVILEVATSEEKKSDPDIRAIKLEVVTKQNERIKQEQAEREAAAKKKESAEKAAEAPVLEEVTEEPIAAATDVSTTSASEPSTARPLDEKVVVVTLPDNKTVKVPLKDGDEKLSTEEREAISELLHSDQNLSTEEMEAISQLLSADPVSKERAELERIKSAMHADEAQEVVNFAEGEVEVLSSDEKPILPGTESLTEPSATPEKKDDVVEEVVIETDPAASAQIQEIETKAAEESAQSTTFSAESEIDTVTPSTSEEVQTGEEDTDSEEESEDPVVARLKKRIESMVSKIEVQLSDVEVRIGDKLHILDKDMDGILTREEMANCLQQVLKRNISFDEAMAIANEMDENNDGIFTVQELIRWIETNRLVKLEEEGRDADMDRIMEEHSAAENETEDPPQQKG